MEHHNWIIQLISEKITPEFFGKPNISKEQAIKELFDLINTGKIVVYADKTNKVVFLLVPEKDEAEIHIIADTRNILSASTKFMNWALTKYKKLIMKTKNPKVASLAKRFGWIHCGDYKGQQCYLVESSYGWSS